MWNWLRSLRSWFNAKPKQTAALPPGRRSPGAYSMVPGPPQQSALPSSEEKPPRLDWQPLVQPPVEEDTVAPPLTHGRADRTPVLGIDLGTSHSVVAVVRQGKVEVIPNQEGEY